VDFKSDEKGTPNQKEEKKKKAPPKKKKKPYTSRWRSRDFKEKVSSWRKKIVGGGESMVQKCMQMREHAGVKTAMAYAAMRY